MSYEDFERGFMDCALWLAGREHDYGFVDIDDIEDAALREEMQSDCRDFYKAHAALIEGAENQAGHDFYLTRNGHGAGFWDGDWPEPAATKLTQAAKVYGSTDDLDLYLKGDDHEGGN